MVDDNMLRKWISMRVEDEVVAHGRQVILVGGRMGMFYAYDGLVGSRDLEWIQKALNVPIGLS